MHVISSGATTLIFQIVNGVHKLAYFHDVTIFEANFSTQYSILFSGSLDSHYIYSGTRPREVWEPLS